jgi:ClpP class serine protease
VIAAHDDISAALEMEGISMTLIAAGPYKTEGNSFDAPGQSDAEFDDLMRDD